MNTKFRAWDEEKQKMFYRVMVGNCDQNDENRNCPVVYYEGSCKDETFCTTVSGILVRWEGTPFEKKDVKEVE